MNRVFWFVLGAGLLWFAYWQITGPGPAVSGTWTIITILGGIFCLWSAKDGTWK